MLLEFQCHIKKQAYGIEERKKGRLGRKRGGKEVCLPVCLLFEGGISSLVEEEREGFC